ncbi:AVN_HP_G0084230.mRNA.1.CDS.1 [Saccharomyces cerevisiae]|nr:AVN_HP_G0084230.mRNA.1.CDS.1 [Saccharomyces cerevisiae]CAI6961519.1 AVN_HP_G0084230.mRNA.1.CDS.1 [Saccharomyces cerevisiae]
MKSLLSSTPEDLLSRKEMTTDSQLPGFARTYLGLFELVRTIILTYSRLLKIFCGVKILRAV